MRAFALGCTVLGVLATEAVVAAESTSLTNVSAVADDEGVLSGSRAVLRDTTEWLAREVDSWFGDRPFEDGGRVSGSLRLKASWRRGDNVDGGVRLRARVQLPNLKERAYLFFGQDNESDLVTDRQEAFTRERQLLDESRRRDTTGFAGVGYALRERLDLRAGVRSAYKPYIQLRYRQRWAISPRDAVSFRETLFWTSSDGAGSNTSFDYEHAYSPVLLFAWQNSVVITRRDDGAAWSSSLGAFRAFGDQRRLSLELLASGNTSSGSVSEYGVRGAWAQPLYRDWVIGELIVGHFWPREHDAVERSRHWAVGGNIELLF